MKTKIDLIIDGHQRIMKWLDIYIDKDVYIGNNHCNVQVLRNCVHPKLGLHIFNCAFKTKQVILSEVI